MTDTAKSDPRAVERELEAQAFARWCEASGLSRDDVRRNYALIRRRYEADPRTPVASLPPPPKPYDRYQEL
jgi:hypothetical protein